MFTLFIRETIIDNYIWFVSYSFISLWWCSKLSPCLGGQLYNIKQVGVYSVPFNPKRYTTKLRRIFLISYFFVSNFLCILAKLIFPKRGDCKGCCLWDSWSVYSNLLYFKKNKIYLWGWNIFYIFVKQLKQSPDHEQSKYKSDQGY